MKQKTQPFKKGIPAFLARGLKAKGAVKFPKLAPKVPKDFRKRGARPRFM